MRKLAPLLKSLVRVIRASTDIAGNWAFRVHIAALDEKARVREGGGAKRRR